MSTGITAMFAAPFILRHRELKTQTITLGWPQFVAMVFGLCAVLVVWAILAAYDIYDGFYRQMVVPYEQAFGFEVGLVKGHPSDPPSGVWGIVRVTPGGIMDRAGLRAGDYVVGTHTSFPELYGAIHAATEGRSECFAVINVEDARAGTYRSRLICLIAQTR